KTTGYAQEPGIGYRFSMQGEFPWMVSINHLQHQYYPKINYRYMK
ncbi:hypothetical protein AVEN_157342-1, partial [Araneus ventricosus]